MSEALVRLLTEIVKADSGKTFALLFYFLVFLPYALSMVLMLWIWKKDRDFSAIEKTHFKSYVGLLKQNASLYTSLSESVTIWKITIDDIKENLKPITKQLERLEIYEKSRD